MPSPESHSPDTGRPEKKSACTVSAEVQDRFKKILVIPSVLQGLAFLKADQKRRIAEQIAITEIPAPPFEESIRAEDFLRRLTELGLTDAHMDREGNAIGTSKGTAGGPRIVVSAHLDTVFSQGYDATVRVDENGILHAPGIADDGAGLAALLGIVRAFRESGIRTAGDVLFVGTVGEEGRGDLRGVKHLFEAIPDIDGFISIDGEGASSITYLALGSKRFEFRFTGTGGHSYEAFGRVGSPIHAMGRAIGKIADLRVPGNPRTTFTVSVVSGGTSVNSIAAEAVMQTDTRSTCPEQLDRTVSELVNCAKAAVVEENAFWKIAWDSPDNIRLEIRKIGDRPSGTCSAEAIHVQSACAATEAIGETPRLKEPGSTDSSIPISLGVPALTLGRGGKGLHIHSPKESFDPTGSDLASRRIFLTILGLAGIAGEIEPLLKKEILTQRR
ncbi:MAG: M20/M25/M40 family metallo-hydrolase [Desulfobacteraceae bacterium]|nr:MAG: M20/M25/M40 family metallo-hydrolase [Desulfobacteraceae bacterium]